MSLTIGPGFQQFIDERNATPKSDELYFSREMSCMMVEVADANGQKQNMLLFYNKPTNEIVPFVQATL